MSRHCYIYIMEEEISGKNPCLWCGFDVYFIEKPRLFCNKTCRKNYNNKLKSENKSEEDEYVLPLATIKQLSKEKQHIKSLVRSARLRATKKNIPFDLHYRDLEMPTHCPLLGVPLVPKRVERKSIANAASLDRIIPELGYVKGNVWIISWRANQMKSNISIDDLVKFSKSIISKFDKKLSG